MVLIKSNERVAFVGKTGSGKTYAARILTRSLQRLVVFDSKGTLADSWNLVDWNDNSERRLKNGEALRVRVPAPLDGNYEPYLQACYEAQHLTVYIDEMYGLLGTSNKPSPYLTALYTRGRELGIGVWASTQRPAWVPLFMLSEADWIFLFRLQLDTDRKRVAEIMGPRARTMNLSGHELLLFNQEWDNPKFYPMMEARYYPRIEAKETVIQ